jgi:hypothetical protein
MSDEWFAEKLAPDSVLEDGCHPNEANALKAYIRKHTTPQEAVQAIKHTMLDSEDPRWDMWRVWSLVMSAFIKLPSEYIAELINLLLVIQDLSQPDLKRADEKKNKLLGPIWRGLGFGHVWSDHYKSDSWRDYLNSKDAASLAAM